MICYNLKKSEYPSERIFAFIVVLIMILGSGDSANVGLRLFARYGLICLNFLITGMLCLRKKKCNLFMLKVLVILCATVLASMIVNIDVHGYTMWILLAIAFFTEETIDYEVFYQEFENIVLWISVFSLIGMGLWFIRPDIVRAFPPIDGAVTDVRNLYVTVIPTTYVGSGFRNYGIFREPAMFCIYIGMALVRQLFFTEKLSIIRCVIFIGAIVTTTTAKGYIALAFLLAAFLFLKKKKKKEKFFVFIVLTGGVIAGEILDIYSYFLDKIDIQGAAAYSVNSRMYSIIGGVMAGFTNPIFGRGGAKSGDVFTECIELLPVQGDVCWANMITFLFASFGIVFVLLFLLGLYGMGLTYCDSKIILGAVVIFIVLLLCGEIMTYSTIMYVFMMYGLKNLWERKMLEIK